MKTTTRNFTFLLLIAVLSCTSEGYSQFFKRNHHAKVHLNWDDEEEMEEDTIKGLSFGLNLGGYFGNAKSAAVYNGSGFDGYLNEAAGIRWYSIADRIGYNGQFLNDIRDISTFYNATGGYTIPWDSYPTNMKYVPSISVGLNLKWNFNRYSALVMNMNAIKLKATGQFTLQFLGTPAVQNAQADVRLFTITGDEQRFNLNLGYRQGWMMGDFSNFYFQFGGSMLGTKWTANTIRVADRNYNLVTSPPVQGATTVNATPTTGVGFGGYASTGVEFFVGRYTFDISFGMSRDKVIIHTYEKNLWNKWLQFTFMI